MIIIFIFRDGLLIFLLGRLSNILVLLPKKLLGSDYSTFRLNFFPINHPRSLSAVNDTQAFHKGVFE